MKNYYFIQVVMFLFLISFTAVASADESPYSVSLSGGIHPFVSGDAGHENGAPGYSDAFKCGLSMAAEISYHLNPSVSILGGIGYIRHSGDTYQGIEFSNLDIIPMYIGMKYHFRDTARTWTPYLRADMGMARFHSVDIAYLGKETRYWDSSMEWMMDAGIGVEYRMNTMAWFIEAKALYMDSPSSDLPVYSEADPSWSIPVAIGVTFYF